MSMRYRAVPQALNRDMKHVVYITRGPGHFSPFNSAKTEIRTLAISLSALALQRVKETRVFIHRFPDTGRAVCLESADSVWNACTT